MRLNFLWLGLLPIIFVSCLGKQESIPQQDRFFDLRAFMEDQKQLLGETVEVKKIVWVDEEKESHEKEAIQIDRELDLFANADINRVAWLDKYGVDSLYENNRLKAIQYRALEEQLQTRKLDILFDRSNEVSKIEIERSSESWVIKTVQNLIYEPKKGYKIDSEQDLIFFEPHSLSVFVQYVNVPRIR